ncbi:hypothetical protein SAMN05216419_100459 [Nitrosomonas cryotolerans]|nr:hypothetical protein SAMN05216419_100459 [Nitrosomonas cryotolerans]
MVFAVKYGVHQVRLPVVLLCKFCWRQIICSFLFSLPVIVGVGCYILDDFLGDLLSCYGFPMIHPFVFEYLPEIFHGGAIPAIILAIHGKGHFELF